MKLAHPEISVVVPTRDRPRSLAHCLASLEAQTARDSLEIVVVDDGSVQIDAVADVVSKTHSARLVRQPPLGAAAARNAGVRVAGAPVICFTDDDCEPRPDWAQKLRARLGRGADAVAGLTANGCPGNRFSSASHVIVSHLMDGSSIARDQTTFGTSNNLACKVGVFSSVPFDETYGSTGEDRDWCARLTRHGFRLTVEQRAVVLHLQELSFTTFWRKHVRYGRGAGRFRRAHGSAWHLERPAFYSSLIRRGFHESASVGTLVCVAQAATAVGYVEEVLSQSLRLNSKPRASPGENADHRV